MFTAAGLYIMPWTHACTRSRLAWAACAHVEGAAKSPWQNQRRLLQRVTARMKSKLCTCYFAFSLFVQ